jgi:hypothetical protein
MMKLEYVKAIGQESSAATGKDEQSPNPGLGVAQMPVMFV